MACGPKGHVISIHALLAESDGQKHIDSRADNIISIHALLAESDKKFIYKRCKLGRFLSTLSLRRATAANGLADAPPKISIHALLAESDNILCVVSIQIGRFLSTLSLRRATPVRDIIQWEGIFLSTLSLRRATETQKPKPTR